MTVLLVVESPIESRRSRDIMDYIVEPLSEHVEVDTISLLPGDPKNGKSLSKTELRGAPNFESSIAEYDYVLLIGNGPLQWATGHAGISKHRGRPFEKLGCIMLPMNNPSMIRHDPRQESLLQNDLDLFLDIIEFGGIPEEKQLNIKLVSDPSQFPELIEDLLDNRNISVDLETNSLNPFQTHVIKRVGGVDTRIKEPAKIVSLGFGTRRYQWVLPMNVPGATLTQDQVQDLVDEITERGVLEDAVLELQNGKFDMLWMWVHFGVRWKIGFDTMLAHYMLDENSRHGLKYLAQLELGAADWEVSLDVKQARGDLSQMVKYHAHDLFYTRELAKVYRKRLRGDPDVKAVYDHILLPSANLFVEIEYDGVWININQFAEAEATLRAQYDSALESLRQWEPKEKKRDKRGREIEFNWGSPAQLADLLFNQLGIPSVEKTASGNESCSESVIKRIDHPCTQDLLRFREAKQQLSFFIDGWKPHLHKRPDGYYLHPSFKLHGTVTGRLSCENPNLQQVPRDPRIRSLISAPDGWTLIECDLSQIELRVAAELSGERAMIHAFINGIDIHWLTAIQEISRSGALPDLVISTARTWLNKGEDPTYSEAIKALLEMGPDVAISIDPRWKEYRKKAKAINFGYLYGMWWKKFKDYARDNYGVIITDSEAEDSREAFFDNYPDLPDWHTRQKRFVNRHGFVSSLSGRKRRLPEAMNPENTPERKAAERQAINSPVQSFANDLNLMAALQLRREFGRSIVRICGTVHDAVLFRVRNDWVDRVYTRMLEIMSGPDLMKTLGISLTVPIEADGSIGPWGKGVSLEKWRARDVQS